MTGRDDIVREARAWIGTPFVWQASAKGRGCDCKGLVVGVARELGLPEAASLYAQMARYRDVDVRLLRAGLDATLIATRKPERGDVLLLTVGGKPQHLAIMTEPGRMVHTYGKGPSCVVEVPMGRVWAAAIAGAWTWSNLA